MFNYSLEPDPCGGNHYLLPPPARRSRRSWTARPGPALLPLGYLRAARPRHPTRCRRHCHCGPHNVLLFRFSLRNPLAHRIDARWDRHTNPRAGPKSVTDFATDESTAGCECEALAEWQYTPPGYRHTVGSFPPTTSNCARAARSVAPLLCPRSRLAAWAWPSPPLPSPVPAAEPGERSLQSYPTLPHPYRLVLRARRIVERRESDADLIGFRAGLLGSSCQRR